MALFDGLPAGYNLQSDIATIDDGTPPKFDVAYAAADGVSVSGKLPANIATDDIATFLNISDVAGTPMQSLTDEDTQTGDQLAALSGWLPELETVTYSKSADDVSVDAVTAPGVDSDLVLAGLSEAMGGDVNVTVAAPSDLPSDGAERVNQATGRSETFTGGFWLPMYDFASDTDNCNAQSAAALETDSISFVTGSATLDAKSMRAINAVASILRKCLSETDMNVEIGGHTDSQGGEDLNRELSQSRAEAVRVALISRGVSDAGIVAKGYGEAEPIADNETEEGRKANRRTTITWFAPIVDAPVVDDENNTVTTDTNTEVGE